MSVSAAAGDGRNVTNEQPLFAMVPEALLYDPAISDKAIRLYGVLRRHGDDPADCFPSKRRLAEFMGCAGSSIGRPLRELEDAGWIRRVPRRTDSGDPDSNGYYVHLARTSSAGYAQESAEGTRSENGGVRAQERAKREPVEREPLNETMPADAVVPPREEDLLQDARELCDMLAVKVAKARGEQDRPLVNARWLKDMDLLLRLGPAGVEPRPLEPEKVGRAIEYLFSSLAEEDRGGFCWADQVRSPGALRKHYVQIREAKKRKERDHHQDAPPVRDPGGSPLAEDWRDAADG